MFLLTAESIVPQRDPEQQQHFRIPYPVLPPAMEIMWNLDRL
jgi:hypothetical protein